MNHTPNLDNGNSQEGLHHDTRQGKEDEMQKKGQSLDSEEGQLLSIVFMPNGQTTVTIAFEGKLITSKF